MVKIEGYQGEGLSGQTGRQGYMMLLGVLVRPPLMIMGFLTAVIIMSIIGQFVGMSFKIFATSVSAGHVSGFVTVICMMFVLGSLVIVLSQVFYW